MFLKLIFTNKNSYYIKLKIIISETKFQTLCLYTTFQFSDNLKIKQADSADISLTRTQSISLTESVLMEGTDIYE